MARKIIFRYKDPDSTYLWNEMYRRMFRPGVYMGFAVSPGSNGSWWLRFTHETDPDNTSARLGIIYTREGSVVRENADQDNVCNGSVSSGLPNIHYVIASYTYNAAVPQNDVAYFVRQGTPGTPPTPPSLGADEVLLAEIYVPSGSASYSATGVQIRNVGHLSLYGTGVDVVNALQGVLKPGIYTGLYSYQGTAWSKVSLAAGQWITLESHEVSEAAAQDDKFTLTDPGPGLYRYAWIIGAHKYADSNPYPTADYLLVEGTAVAVGSSASLPTATAVRTAVATLNPKYDTDGDGLAEVAYVNYLGYVRVENRAGAYYVDYMKGTSLLDADTLHVYGARATSMQRSGSYYGHQGLLQAIEDVYAVSKSIYPLAKPYTLVLEGDFDLADTALRLPSHIRLQGNGAPARIRSNSDDVVLAQGYEAIYDAVNPTITQSTVSIPNTPTGYVGRQFAVQATYQVGDSIQTRKFCKGDRVFIAADMLYYGEGIFVENVSDWTFNLWVPDAYNTAGNPVIIDLHLLKQDVHLESLDIDRISTGAGALRFNLVEKCSADQIRCRKLSNDVSYESRFGYIEITNAVSWGASSTYPYNMGEWGRNNYRHLKFTAFTPVVVGSTSEVGSHFGRLQFGVQENTSGGLPSISSATVRLNRSTCQDLRFYSGSGGALEIIGTNAHIDYAYIVNCTFKFTTIGAHAGHIENGGSSTLVFGVGCQDAVIVSTNFNPFAITDTAANPSNRILVGGQNDLKYGMEEHANSDRNLKMVSTGNLSWNSTTGVLSWSAAIRFDNPWTSGYSSLAAGSATLSVDGDRLWVDIDRDASAITAVTATVEAKTSGASKYAKHRVFVAVRDQGVIYLWEGTRVEDGQSVRLGQTVPPDGSVTYEKLADSAKAFHNAFFRDYVILDNTVNDALDIGIVFRNTALRTYTYTPSTGVIQYSGTVSLSLAKAGDYLIIREQDWSPGTGGKGGYTLEQVLAVDDANDRVTLRKGLDLTVGSANQWNGAIGRGGKVMSNDTLVTYSYDADGTNPGRVTYSSGMGFSQYQVRVGYIWIDSAGNKYVIRDLDTSGAGTWITIAPGLRGVVTTAPTSAEHGSIEANTNPHRLPVADLRCLMGVEYLPIHQGGIEDTSHSDLMPPHHATYLYKCHYTEPYDPRVRIWQAPLQWAQYLVPSGPSGSGVRAYEPYNPSGGTWVEFTGWCTGAILLFGDQADSTSPLHLWVDGELISSGVAHRGSALDVAYGSVHNYNTPGINRTGMKGNRAFALPPGIHHLMWEVGQTGYASGILILNHPTRQDKTLMVKDAPGAAVQDGGVRTYSETQDIAVPLTDQAWDKGGRVLRYLDKDGNRQWASQWVRGHTDTGDVQSGSADVAEVANPSLWMKGDLILFIDGTTKYLRRVVSKAGDVLTMDSAISYTQTGTTMYYYGTSFLGAGSAPGVLNAAERTQEEMAFFAPILEFGAPGPLAGGYSVAAVDTVLRTTDILVTLSDQETALLTEGATKLTQAGAAIALTANAQVIRFNFVGTGCSILQTSIVADKIRVYVDGIDCGLIPVSTGYQRNSETGEFIVGGLPYGSHTVKLLAITGVTSLVYGFYIWQPKLPAVPTAHLPVLELADTNVLGVTEKSLGVTPVGDRVSPVIGMVQQDAIQVGSFDYAAGIPFTDTVSQLCAFPRLMSWGAGGTTAQASAAFFCYGDEFILQFIALERQANTIYVEFMDHDGTWKAPSALTGFAVTGIDSWVANIAVFTRQVWQSSKCGPHFIRFRCGAASQHIWYSAMECHTPYHSHRTVRPYALRHTLPWQWGGTDRRNCAPFDLDLVPRDEMLITAALHDPTSTVAPDEHEVFWFYSLGGYVEVEVGVGSITPGGDWYIGLVIDGQTLQTTHLGAAAEKSGDLRAMVWMAPGFHYAYLTSDAVTNIKVLSWTAKSFRQGALASPTKGLGLPSYGSLGSRLASY